MRRVDLEVDRLSVDALIVPCYAGCFVLDLVFDVFEVLKCSSWQMVEFCPFAMSSYTCCGMWNVEIPIFLFVIILAGYIDEL